MTFWPAVVPSLAPPPAPPPPPPLPGQGPPMPAAAIGEPLPQSHRRLRNVCSGQHRRPTVHLSVRTGHFWGCWWWSLLFLGGGFVLNQPILNQCTVEKSLNSLRVFPMYIVTYMASFSGHENRLFPKNFLFFIFRTSPWPLFPIFTKIEPDHLHRKPVEFKSNRSRITHERILWSVCENINTLYHIQTKLGTRHPKRDLRRHAEFQWSATYWSGEMGKNDSFSAYNFWMVCPKIIKLVSLDLGRHERVEW